MALYTMADFHLSLSTDKPMDIFGTSWENHVEKIKENWCLTEDDIIVIPGDISWAMNLEEARADFDFLSSLPGKKIIGKGNHDYWWNTINKLENFAKPYENISFLHNNSYDYGDISICGSRGWIQESGSEADLKILKREALRLETSIKSANKTPVVFLHYPPVFADQKNELIIEVLEKYGIKECYYGHLHGPSIAAAKEGEENGVVYKLVSADSLSFMPFPVRK